MTDRRRADDPSLFLGSPVLRALRERVGVELGVLLSEADGAGPIVRPRAPELGDLEGKGNRYDLLGAIAEGGMGVVVRGRDRDLGRDVAVKVLRRRAAEDPSLAYRFVEEGQIGGQLQHPGIVPVYELGLIDGTRPFLAMKLVKGKTLAALLQGRRSPDVDRAYYLRVFEQIAQTMAYVHARRVIHRDLKPSNVMIGAFGEVQVMDFGLAKVLHLGEVQREPCTPETVVETARSGTPAHHSRPGSVMGTYAYMPPEQANGEVDRLDERCDVFAMGAVLCEILTGKAPYTGSLEAVRSQAREGGLETARRRLASCGVEEAVVAVALRCLAHEPEERFADAAEVAAAMGAYRVSLEERARRSTLAAARSQARAAEARARVVQERRARRLGLALAAAVLLLIVAGGVVWQSLAVAIEQRDEELRQRVSAELERSMLLRGQAAAAAPDLPSWSRALDAARSAQRIASTGDVEEGLRGRVDATVLSLAADLAAVRGELERAERARAMVARLDAIETEIGDHFDFRNQDRLYAGAFEDFGLDVYASSVEDAAERVRASGIGPRLLRAFNLWATAQNAIPEKRGRSEHLNRISLLAETDEGARRIREIGQARDREAAYSIARSDDLVEYSVLALLSLSEYFAFFLDDTPTAVRILETARDEYPDDLWVRLALAQHLRDLDRPRLDDALREYTAALALRDDAQMWMHIGVVHMQLGDWEQALAAYEQAVERDPVYVAAINNVGLMRGNLGDQEAALECYTECAALAPDDPTYEFNRGNTLLRLERFEEAAEAFERAARLGDTEEYSCLQQRADALLALGRPDEAVAAAELALEKNSSYSPTYGTLIEAYRRSGREEEIPPLLLRLLEDSGGTARAAIAASHTLLQLKLLDDAVRFCYQAVEKVDAPEVWHNLGVALRRTGRPLEAIGALERTFDYEAGHYDVHNEIGICYADLGRLDEACAAYERTLALEPEYVHAWHNLGNAHDRAGRAKDAIAAYEKALSIDPDYHWAHAALGDLYGRRGDALLALRSYTRGAECGSKRAHFGRGLALAGLGRHEDAAEAFLEATRTGVSRNAWNQAGWNLVTCGRLTEAVDVLSAGLDRRPDGGDLYHNLGWALFHLDELEASADAMESAVRLAPRSDGAHAMYGITLQWLGRFEEARSEYRMALELSTTEESRETRAGYLREIEAILFLESRLDEYVDGTRSPADTAEAIALARLAFAKGRHSAALRFYETAFELDAATRDDLEEEHLYDAARAAIHAGREADAQTGRALRDRAQLWLGLAVDLHRVNLGSEEPAARHRTLKTMRQLQVLEAFDDLREPEEAAVPAADEREAWRALWRRIDELEREAAALAPAPLPSD